MKNINSVIFDLGGVIINLDTEKTVSAFSRQSNMSFRSVYEGKADQGLFDNFEKGKIETSEFYNEIRKRSQFTGSDEDLVKAWNAMLLDVPEERLDALVEMKHNYNTYLLSNTNEIHIRAIELELHDEHGIKHFEDYFDKIYYSCRLGMRKPDREIFELVLNENNLKPEETVFIDDSAQHVKAAGELGINAFLLQKNMSVNDLLRQLKLL